MSERLRRFDLFGSPIQLRYPDGSTEYRTACGSYATLFAFLVSLVFLISQILVMKGYNATLFTNAIAVDYFDKDYVLKGDSSDFKIAVGTLSGLWDITVWIEIDRYDFSDLIEIPTEPCSEEDIAKFYPMRESQRDILEFGYGLLCLDYSKLEIMG